VHKSNERELGASSAHTAAEHRTIASFKVQALVALLDGLKLAVVMIVGTQAQNLEKDKGVKGDRREACGGVTSTEGTAA